MQWVVITLVYIAFAFFILTSLKNKSRAFALAFLVAASAALIALLVWGVVRNFA